MLVRIRAKDGPNLCIPLPTVLLFNRFTAGIAARAAAKQGAAISPEQMTRLFQVIHACKRRRPDWVMVQVHSADGDYVEVKL